MSDGWVKLWRKMLDNPYLYDPLQCRVFIEALLDAEHEPRERRHAHGVVKLGRGQAILSQRVLAQKFKVGRQQIRRAISNLEKGGIFNPHTNPHFTIVTLCQFEHYQGVQPTVQPTVQPKTNPSPTRLQEGEEGLEGKNLPLESPRGEAKTNGSRKPAKRGTQIGDWQPDDELRRFAVEQGISRDRVRATFDQFRDHYLGNGKPMKDWRATWRNWCRRNANGEFGRPARQVRDPPPPSSGFQGTDVMSDLLHVGKPDE